MLDNKLIESALQLTGKTMEDMNIPKYLWDCNVNWMAFPEFWDKFSIEKFCYYLLDKKFLIKYYQNKKPWYTPSIETTDLMAGEFWYAIMEYQSWNENPLIELLSKICPTDQTM